MLGTILSGDGDRDRAKPPLRHPQSPQIQRGLCSGGGRAGGSGAPPALRMGSGVGEGRGEGRKAGLVLRLVQLFKI